MKIKIAGVIAESVVDRDRDADGHFCQVCPYACPVCYNFPTHDPASGHERLQRI